MKNDASKIPSINAQLSGGFRWFGKRFLRKHFHSFAVNRQALPGAIDPSDCLVVYCNHASWWDPLAALFISDKIFPAHRLYAPIDAEALEKYAMFAKMGFFPVERDSLKGAASFLRTATAILSKGGNSVWVTPEGRFVDPRDRQVPLEAGLAHLAARLARKQRQTCPALTDSPNSAGELPPPVQPRVWFVAAAVEYVFWEEKQPEILAWFAEPIALDQVAPAKQEDKSDWQQLLTARLRDAQDRLAAASIARDSSAFEVVLGARSGTFFFYDAWRQFRGLLSGRRFDIDHSDKLR